MPYDEEGRYIYPLPARKSSRVKAARPVTPPTPPPLTASEPPLAKIISLPVPPGPPLVAKPSVAELEKIAEQDLAELWNAQSWPAGLELYTAVGQSLKVIYRGRWSFGMGPDFQGAILEIEGQIKRGDIEIHRTAQDWRGHGHQQNAKYDGVILHVALTAGEVTTSKGQNPAVLALLEIFGQDVAELQTAIKAAQEKGTRLGSLSESAGPCCELVAERHPNLEEVLARVDGLGEKRFLERAEKYEIAFNSLDETGEETSDPSKAFWTGLLEALGYSQNKGPFRQLAEVLPLGLVLEMDSGNQRRGENVPERIMNLEAILLGAAGLLPTQRLPRAKLIATAAFDPELDPEDWVASRYVDELERRWALLERFLKAGLPTFKPMSISQWNFARIRPVNHPSRRLAGLARFAVLLSPASEHTLIEKVSSHLLTLSPAESCKALAALFTVELAGEDSESGQFWSSRYDLTLDRLPLRDEKTAPPALIGADRAADIVVNVALPFLRAYGQDQRDKKLAEKALLAYRAHPRLGSNELVENVAKQVFRYWLEGPGELPESYQANSKGPKRSALNRLVNGAMRQQGLIQLHHRFCLEQAWGSCPLS